MCDTISISDLPFLSKSIKKYPCFKLLTISSTLTAWWKFHKITNSTLTPSKLTPIWNNPDLLINKKSPHFHTWAEKGITQLQHIFQDNTLVSFTHLVQNFGIRSTQFLEYLQLQSSIQKAHEIKNINLDLPPTTSAIITIKSAKKLTSKIYKIISV